MTVSLTFGWWLAPLLVTVISFAWAYLRCMVEGSGGFMPAGVLLAMLLFPLAAVLSLIAWLIWALVAP